MESYELCNWRKNDKSNISEVFTINNETSNDPKTIANGFCRYFTNVGQTLAEKIPQTDDTYKKYLNNNAINNSIYLNPTSNDEIINVISNMKSKKSTGHDGISTQFIKQIKFSISQPLAILINRSMIEGKVPDCLKLAKVIPVYKAKDKQVLSNYRPISLLPSISKIYEKIMHKRIYQFLERSDLLYIIASLDLDPNGRRLMLQQHLYMISSVPLNTIKTH